VLMVNTGFPKTTVAGNNASVRRGLCPEPQSEILESDNLRCLPILSLTCFQWGEGA
jgi:hypothetical protein